MGGTLRYTALGAHCVVTAVGEAREDCAQVHGRGNHRIVPTRCSSERWVGQLHANIRRSRLSRLSRRPAKLRKGCGGTASYTARTHAVHVVQQGQVR
jgi:hypothetical protein